MGSKHNSPWVKGTIEILTYADSLRKENKESSYRLCFLIIDNAVEVLIRTFLTLPERLSGIIIGRKEMEDATESFPQLINLLENKAKRKLLSVNLGEIEWYHRQRNSLYHNGTGLTIELSLVDGYFIQSKFLLLDLFGVEYDDVVKARNRDFLLELAKFERWVRHIGFYIIAPGADGVTRVPSTDTATLIQRFYPMQFSNSFIDKLKKLQEMRNLAAHRHTKLEASDNTELLNALDDVSKEFSEAIEKEGIDIKNVRKDFEDELRNPSVQSVETGVELKSVELAKEIGIKATEIVKTLGNLRGIEYKHGITNVKLSNEEANQIRNIFRK